MKSQTRVLAIHDISCAGRCSVTVALPIISSLGIETNIVPTALLSTQTGDIDGYTYLDLTNEMLPIARHWQMLNRAFDAIYTGYLGSFDQIDIIKDIFSIFNGETLKFVDPVMADHGKLYDKFDLDFVKGMRSLCLEADIISPNITEAVFLLEEEYREGPYTYEYIESLLRKLSRICKKAIITGISFEDGMFGACAYDSIKDKVMISKTEKVTGKFHGTGDVFASSFLACLMTGLAFNIALDFAVDFTVKSIKRTKDSGSDVRFGINFEEGLYDFIKNVKSLL